MSRYKKLAAAAVAILVLFGCTAQKPPLRRYVIANNTDSTISDLKVTFREGEKSWEQTLAGQGWTYSGRHDGYFTLSWHDLTGDHEQNVVHPKNTIFQSKNNLYIELNGYGSVTVRAIEPPPDDRSWSALIPFYVLYCLFIGLFIGVPLALIFAIAYVLFKFIRAILVATAQGLQGDNSVFQFTIREIAMLTVMVALACGWFVNFWAMKH